MSSRYLYLVRMDVAHDVEPTFNEVYDTEHVPLLQAVPGVLRASRYRSPSPTDPRYIAAYEFESPAVLQSAEWKAAGEAGRWAGEIRPHTMNRHLAMYEWVGSNAGLTYRTPYVFWVFMDVEKHREDLFNELYDARARPAAAQAARLRQRGALPHRGRGRAALPRRLRGRPHRPAHVQALERHLGHRPLEARGAPLHATTSTTSSASASGRGADAGSVSPPAFEGRRERVLRHRLRDVVVHAGRQTLFAVDLHGVGRQGDDGDAPGCPGFPRADRSRRPEPIHPGHLAIHEHQIVGDASQGVDGFQAVGHDIHPMAELLEHSRDHLLVHPVVLGHENAERRRRDAGGHLLVGCGEGRAARRLEASACENGWNSLARAAVRMPMPLSDRHLEDRSVVRAGSHDGCGRRQYRHRRDQHGEEPSHGGRGGRRGNRGTARIPSGPGLSRGARLLFQPAGAGGAIPPAAGRSVAAEALEMRPPPRAR